MKTAIVGAVLFMSLGLMAGFISDWITGMMGLTSGIITAIVTFGVMFALLAWMGRARMNMGNLAVFCILGYVSSLISGFMGDMMGLTGSLLSGALTFLVFFGLLLMLGPREAGVTNLG